MLHRTLRVSLVIAVVLIMAVALVAAGGTSIYQAYQTPPIKLGTSGGNATDRTTSYCCSGTLGSVVWQGGSAYILSNNHVLAKSDQGKTGDAITQPGMVDTNCSTTNSTVVANLSKVSTLGTQNVDAALATVAAGKVSSTGEILGVGVPAGTMATPALSMGVAKAGRTTGLTCGTVNYTNVNVNIQYETQCNGGTTWTISYKNQLGIGNSRFSAGGDSGSLIVTSAGAQPVGLLFAGSSTMTIANPIADVSSAFNGISFGSGATHTVSSCAGGGGKKPRSAAIAAAKAAKELHADDLMTDPAVIGVGIGADEDVPGDAVVAVFVETGRAHRDIPSHLDGVKVKVINTEKIRAYGWNEPAQANRCGK